MTLEIRESIYAGCSFQKKVFKRKRVLEESAN